MVKFLQWLIIGHIHEWVSYGDPIRRAPSMSGSIGGVVHPVRCLKCGKISQFEID